ncbi:MAG: alpha/beta hydrolase [Neomegalonema sp.]|nr:alpha/beta hydrolase [Neomegalonema sp.]
MSRRQALRMMALGTGSALLSGCASSSQSLRDRYPPQGRFVPTSHGQIHLLEQGEGPAVVLIHGASGNLRDATFRLMPMLARRYRVIAVDRPGFGYSDPGPDDRYRPLAQAAMLREAVSSLGVRKPIVVGHSYGGAVAMAWGLQAQDEISGVVSLSGATYPWDGGVGLGYEIAATPVIGDVAIAIVRLGLTESVARDFIDRIFAPQNAPSGYADHVAIGLALRAETIKANAQDLTHLNDELATMAPRYGEIHTPVGIVHGTADTTVALSIHSEKLAKDVQKSRLIRLDGVGHMPHIVAPEACVEAIDWVAAQSGRNVAD